MAKIETLELLIEGGKASPGPNSAPKLGALKMNTGEIFKAINDKTKEYAGMQIPVKVEMNPADKTFEIIVGMPPASALIKKELGMKLVKFASEKNAEGVETIDKTPVGNITVEQLVKVAKQKYPGLFCRSLKAAVKQVVGTCASMPITVEGKKAVEVEKEIVEGKYDNLIKE